MNDDADSTADPTATAPNATAAPSTAADIARWRSNRQAEVDSAALYGAIADLDADAKSAGVMRRMAESEARHARFWADRLAAAGAASPDPTPSWRARTLIALARRFGPALVLPTLAEAEQAGANAYAGQPEVGGTTMPAEERTHGRLLREMAAAPGGLGGASIARLEGRHASVGGNALRAAVLGANDGLVSNLSLVMGVAGAVPEGRLILITGLAGLLAGAISMALGEWLSVQSSRELYERQIRIEAEELAVAPEEEATELAMIYESKGIAPDQARAMADRIVAQGAVAIDALAREELGIDPNELGGSAWTAALTSFFLFSIGAVLPVAPFMFASGGTAVLASVALSAVGLFGIGAAITLMTGRSVWYSGTRQLIFGLSAAAVTYGVGRAFGVSMGG
ncbi:MAG: VIT1/CCC1 transporter family protein [Ardenticatenales bacterium]